MEGINNNGITGSGRDQMGEDEFADFMERGNKNEYNPDRGQANRYENARIMNKELAEQINEDAIVLVNKAMPIAVKIEGNNELKNFHDPITDGKWMGEYLRDIKNEIIHDLYGVAQLESLRPPYANDVPGEVIAFLQRVQDLNL